MKIVESIRMRQGSQESIEIKHIFSYASRRMSVLFCLFYISQSTKRFACE